MRLNEKAEELLETMWMRTEEEKKDSVAPDDLVKTEKETVEPLLKAGYLVRADDCLKLTDEGRLIARNVVRRHRLSERLLADVLGTGGRLMHEKACKFEHLIDHGLDESICSLLGHPKVCPHGKPIPPGRCCQEGQRQAQPIVAPLSQLAPSQGGKVAYIYASELSQLQKLMAMGILPGAPIKLVQSFPSYVFHAGQTQFAVDKDIADAIYVRLVKEGVDTRVKEKHRRWYKRGKGKWGG